MCVIYVQRCGVRSHLCRVSPVITLFSASGPTYNALCGPFKSHKSEAVALLRHSSPPQGASMKVVTVRKVRPAGETEGFYQNTLDVEEMSRAQFRTFELSMPPINGWAWRKDHVVMGSERDACVADPGRLWWGANEIATYIISPDGSDPEFGTQHNPVVGDVIVFHVSDDDGDDTEDGIKTIALYGALKAWLQRLGEGEDMESMFRYDPLRPTWKQQRLCAGCGGASTFACGRCESARYCGRECQREEWNVHKPACRAPQPHA